MRASEIEHTMKTCSSTHSDVQRSIEALLDNGEFYYLVKENNFEVGEADKLNHESKQRGKIDFQWSITLLTT